MYTANTKFGPVHITPTSADHLHVSFSTGSRGETPLTVRGVEWSGSCHFYLHGADGFRIGQDCKSDYERRSSLYLSRSGDGISYRQSQPTPAAFATIATELTEVIRGWALANAEALAQAQTKHMDEQLERIDAEIAEAETALQALKTRRAEMLA